MKLCIKTQDRQGTLSWLSCVSLCLCSITSVLVRIKILAGFLKKFSARFS